MSVMEERRVGMMRDENGTNPVATVLAGNVGGDINVGPCGSSAVGVDHTLVGAGTVTVDLVNGHLDLATGSDLRKHVTGLSHDGLGAGLKVVGAGANSLANGICGVTLETGAVLLEGVAAGSVTGSRAVDAESHAGAACGSSGPDDGTVSVDEGNESEESSSLHFEGLFGVLFFLLG